MHVNESTILYVLDPVLRDSHMLANKVLAHNNNECVSYYCYNVLGYCRYIDAKALQLTAQENTTFYSENYRIRWLHRSKRWQRSR